MLEGESLSHIFCDIDSFNIKTVLQENWASRMMEHMPQVIHLAHNELHSNLDAGVQFYLLQNMSFYYTS